MSKLGILASAFALAVGTAACGNSQGQSNSLVDVGPSMVSSTPSEEGGGNLTTLARGGGGGGGKGSGGSGGGGTTIIGGGSFGDPFPKMVIDSNNSGTPNYGDTITFVVSTTATTRPWVRVDCFQGSTMVGGGSAGFFPEYLWSQDFGLQSASWTGGAADCTAKLYMTDGTSSTTLATRSFHVDP
jgi:hypothetical protein